MGYCELMEPNRPSTRKHRAGRDLQLVKAAIASLAYELWLEKRSVLDAAEVEWLIDGRLTAQLDELSRSQLSRVERLLERTVTHTEKRHMTGSPG